VRSAEPVSAQALLQWLESSGTFQAVETRAIPEGRVG
jgi:hypothetical protein